MFSSISFMVLGTTFESLIHFEFMFRYKTAFSLCEKAVQFNSFAYSCPVF